MQLTLWTYEGPPHIGAMRVATAMRGLHYVLHAPQGDTYADLLFTMIERRDARPPVTYTTFQARDLGADTAALFQNAVSEAYARFHPQAMIVGASCTAELIQDDPGGLARALDLPIPVIPLELPAYQKKENWGASETLYRLVRALAGGTATPRAGRRPLCNILGPTALGFRHRDDLVEITRILAALGIDVNVVAPLGAAPADLGRLGAADFNVVLYPEIARAAGLHLQKAFGQPMVETVPIGQGPQGVTYVPRAVTSGDGMANLTPLGEARASHQLMLTGAGGARSQATLFNQGQVQMLQVAAAGLEPGKPYILAFASHADGSGELEPLTKFMANPAGAAVVNAVGPIRQVVAPEEEAPRRWLVIAAGTPEDPGAVVQTQAQ